MTTRLIHALLPMGRASIANVARAMNRNVRALQRDLAKEGTEFSVLLSDIRAELATSYLQDSTVQVRTVAERLGYSSTTAFIRFFRTRFGVSPQAWRLGSRAAQPAADQSGLASDRC